MGHETDETARLPGELRDALDGRSLAATVGRTILVTAAEPEGVPRQALLSYGEVVATSPTELHLALYPASRTTQAIETAGRCLLTLVHEATVYKISVDTERLPVEDRLAVFVATVREADADTVPYAVVRHGIEYDLLDPGPVLARWERQVAMLRALADGRDGLPGR